MKNYNDILVVKPNQTIGVIPEKLIEAPELSTIWETLKAKYPSHLIDKANFVAEMLPAKAKDYDILDQILNIITDTLQDIITEEELGRFEPIIASLKTIKKQQRILFANKPETQVSETILFFLLNQLTKKHGKTI